MAEARDQVIFLNPSLDDLSLPLGIRIGIWKPIWDMMCPAGFHVVLPVGGCRLFLENAAVLVSFSSSPPEGMRMSYDDSSCILDMLRDALRSRLGWDWIMDFDFVSDGYLSMDESDVIERQSAKFVARWESFLLMKDKEDSGRSGSSAL